MAELDHDSNPDDRGNDDEMRRGVSRDITQGMPTQSDTASQDIVPTAIPGAGQEDAGINSRPNQSLQMDTPTLQNTLSEDAAIAAPVFTGVGMSTGVNGNLGSKVADSRGFQSNTLRHASIPLPQPDLDQIQHVSGDVLPPLPVHLPESGEFGFEPSSSEALNQEQRGYFKLEFPDAQLYIDTLRTVFGRDTDATRRKKMAAMNHDGSHYDAVSVVSESGGIVNLSLKETRRRKRSKGKASRSPSIHKESRSNSIGQSDEPAAGNNVQKSNQHWIPSARIHPDGGASNVKTDKETTWVKLHAKEGSHGGGISREHAAIIYNFDEASFELHIYGRNGAFVNDSFYSQGGVVNLEDGCTITISGVSMRWCLPTTGAEGTMGSEAQSAMSFEFEDGRGESIAMNDTSESSSSDAGDIIEQSSNHSESEGVESNQEDGVEDIQETVESDSIEGLNESRPRRLKLTKPKKPVKSSNKTLKENGRKKADREQLPTPQNKTKASADATEAIPEPINDPQLSQLLRDLPPEMIPQRRKGPGRPPKNGIMSKREQAILMRQQKEAQRAEAIKNGTLKPSKGKSDEAIDASTGKRKYTKRKKLEDEDAQESVEADGYQAGSLTGSKPSRDKRPPKPPRSPSPVFDESQLTEEQLAKPTQSYVVLIHEALSNSETKQMSLPQIYRAIERRYPYFKLKVSTQGWQSSVRHNLSQHAAFKKIERDGKGWMWGLVPEVNIEKEKKRRPTPPPPMPPQNYYQPPPQMFRPPPQGYQYQGMPPNGQPSHPPMGYIYPPPPPGHGFPTAPFPPGMQPPPSIPLPPGASQGNATYKSPYDPAPSAPSQSPETPQQKPPIMQNPYFSHNQLPPNRQALPGPGQFPNGTQTQTPNQHNPAPGTSHMIPFEETQSVVDQIATFKNILMPTLTLADKEAVVDRVIKQALRKMPETKEVNDPNTADAGIYKALVDLLRPLREKYEKDRSPSAFLPPATPNTPKIQASDPEKATAGFSNPKQRHLATHGPGVQEQSAHSHANSGKPAISTPPQDPQSEGLARFKEAIDEVGGNEVVVNTSSRDVDEAPQRSQQVKGVDNTMTIQSQERASIFNLLKRLDAKASEEEYIKKTEEGNVGSELTSEAIASSAPGASVTSATEVLHKSEQAANMVMNSMSSGMKRRHENTDEAASEAQEPPTKRLAEEETQRS